MGAWGPGSFQNDAALDWLAGLEDGDEGYVLDALEPVAEAAADEYLDADIATAAIVAAEVLAAAQGKAAPRLPEPVTEWLAENPDVFEPEDFEVARLAVERVKKASELRDLWQESDLDGWLGQVDRLLGRLT